MKIKIFFFGYFIQLLLLSYIISTNGCVLKNEHTHNSNDSIKVQKEINELWSKVDTQKDILNTFIQEKNRDHLETPIEEIISLSKTILSKHTTIKQEKKEKITALISDIKQSGDNIETYSKREEEGKLMSELNNFNSLILKLRSLYND